MSDNRGRVHRWTREAGSGPSNRYHPLAPRGLYGQSYLRERFVRLIAENSIQLDQMDILDLGCGTGTWCRYFAELKGTAEGIVGVDLSEERLSVARSLSPIRYVQADITDLSSLFDRQFDFVSAFVSLMFLTDRNELRSVFMGVRELLRPGGYFFVHERDLEHDVTTVASGWPRAQLSEEALSAGFDIVTQRGIHKMLLGLLDPLEHMSFSRGDWWPVAERFLPGRWTYGLVLARKPDGGGETA